jgi:hypothetical protein
MYLFVNLIYTIEENIRWDIKKKRKENSRASTENSLNLFTLVDCFLCYSELSTGISTHFLGSYF